ncbi:MAG TPA: hypothetical protein PLV68_17990, partial [Ilumatobacteraceae bacterium]|nr:hypothetical protein [Ilumatobacteraceae bacterium]
TVFDWTVQERKDNPFSAFMSNQSDHLYNTIKVSVVAVDLDRPVRLVTLRRGKRPKQSDRPYHVPTGHAALDAAFVCLGFDKLGAAALDDERFASAMLDIEGLRQLRFGDQRLVFTLDRRKPEQLSAAIDAATGLAKLLPTALYQPPASPG